MGDPVRVRIVGDHPWASFTGVALAISRPKPDALFMQEPAVRVRLDRGQDCPEDHECFAFKGQLEILR